jgi:predicted nucleotide-binding protein
MANKQISPLLRYIDSVDFNLSFPPGPQEFKGLVDEISLYLELTYSIEEKQRFLDLINNNDAFVVSLSKMRAYLFALTESGQLRSHLSSKSKTNNPVEAPSSVSPKSVFIVHGHDNEAKETTARFVEKLGLKAIILHEQPNVGKTIIEKFESFAQNVGFAVVLLTPDDVGFVKSMKDQQNFRARQNVVFELGFFVGKLGRNRVCALVKDTIELPSDYHGVLYVPIDTDGMWKIKLAKEMKSVGLDVDLNQAV